MIHPTTPADTPTLIAIAEGTGVFKPMEIQALREVLDDYHDENHKHGHRCVSYCKDNQVIGFAYWAPTVMTDRGWRAFEICRGRNPPGQRPAAPDRDLISAAL
jgi:hypothetical protein